MYYWLGKQLANYIMYTYILLTLALITAIIGLKNEKALKLSLIFFILATITFPTLISINHAPQLLYMNTPGLIMGISWGYTILLLTTIIIILWKIL